MTTSPASPPEHSPHRALLRALLQDLFAQAVRAVSASVLLPPVLAGISAELQADGASRRLAILAVGKAAGAMMQTALAHLPAPHAGLMVTPTGGKPHDLVLPPQVEAITASHPTPDAESQRAAEQALALAKAADLLSMPEFIVLLITRSTVFVILIISIWLLQ